MATDSIFRTIVLNDAKSIEAFVNAVEESARFSKRNPMPKVESETLTTKEEIIELLDKLRLDE